MKDPFFPYNFRRHTHAVTDASALQTQRLTVQYPGSKAPSLFDVTTTVHRGKRVALVGHNGAGKSTLLKCIAGLLPVRSGTISIYGLTVGACHHRVTYLPQRTDINWRFPITVDRLVLTGRYVHLGWFSRPGAKDVAIAYEVMKRLQLLDLAQRPIGELSGGQQQRALLARSLAQEAELYLLDEPFNAVDAESCEIVQEVLLELSQEGRSILVATHDLGRTDEEFDQVIHLDGGRQMPLEKLSTRLLTGAQSWPS